MMKHARAATRRLLPTSPFGPAPPAPPAEQFAEQDQVTHDKYGLGRVVSIQDDATLVIDFGAHKESRRTHSLAPWTALAATLALGVFLGTMLPHGTSGPLKVDGAKMYAAAALNQALDTQLASAPSGDVRIGMTFRGRAGEICRTFAQASASGLACRSGDHWQIKGLFGAPEGQASDYRMAAGMDPSLAALVDATMTGEPLDAGQEKAEQQRRWR